MDSTKALPGVSRKAVPASSGEVDLAWVAAAVARAEPKTPTLAEGSQVGRYRVVRQLGTGGMGVVYEAYDPELERRVAVKLLKSTFDEARLAREGRALAKLSHPNVVNVYDVGTMDGLAFIAMELVEGATLRQWLAERPRGLRESLEVLMQAGRGLAAAHAAGLVHRDFKPDNVIVGRDGRVRVLDFGIVSPIGGGKGWGDPSSPLALEDDGQATLATGPLTATGVLVGTPAYMAPEQHRAEALDPSADQFGFCVVLWEMVYGTRPFEGGNLQELARRSEGGPPNEPPGGRSAPAWLRRILDRGLAVDRAARHPSMNALLEALEAGLARQLTVAQLLGRRYELLRPSAGAGASDAERAMDRVTGRLVTIQRLAPPSSGRASDAAAARVALAHAFRDLAALRHPNLVGVLDFGFDQEQRPYLVLDLQDDGVPLRPVARRQPARSVVDYLVQILRGLGYLHRHRITLGALEPDAIRVFGDQVKLMALFTLGDTPSSHPALKQVAARPASAADDLYSFGLLAVELLAPHRPPTAGRSSLPADVSALELEPWALPVVERLLAADPAARYRSAEEVIAALAGALGHELAADTRETRESRLCAAPFLGRDAELELLQGAVQEACAGRGSGWLVSGESGVGKSRLLDEVATLGLVNAALVLRGQEESQGGSPYRLFRDALHWLALVTDLDEIEASVLLPIVPSLSRLLGRPVEPAPELDAPSMHARVVDVVQRIFRRQEQPIVLLLEDLQWAHSDSLKLLEGVVALAEGLPLLVVATDRDDEQPRRREELSALRRMHLGRLAGDVIAGLTQAMIGGDGTNNAIVTLIQRETEGNAFFLVEVVRALAEAAGGVERISSSALPSTVFARGVQSVVRQRLRAVPGESQSVLRIAAVIGRRLDPLLLEALVPEVDLEDWIAQCLDAAVLERRGAELRFRHDKLREGLLATLGDDEVRSLHAQVARAIERVYADDPQRYAALAYHFGQAQDRVKEVHYATLAGELAIRHGALREGIALLHIAVEPRAPHPDALELARVHANLANAYYFSTELDQAMSHAACAVRAVGFHFPSGGLLRVCALVWQLLVHIAHRLLPGWLGSYADTARRAAAGVASGAAGRAATTCISLADGPGVLLFSLMALNLSERAGEPDLAASGILGYSLACLGLPRVASSYFASTGRDARADDGAYAILKTSYLLGTGEMDAAEAVIRHEMAVVRQRGFRPAESYSWFLLGHCAYYRGRLDQAETCFAAAHVHEGTRANFVPGVALARCLRGRLGQAREPLDEALAPCNPPAPRSVAYGVLALIQVREGNTAAALEAASTAVGVVARGRTFGYAGAGFFMGVFEAYLAECERLRQSGQSARLARRQLRRVLAHCRAWARCFRIGSPLMLLYQGKIDWLEHRPARALGAWHESLAQAQAMGLGLQVALAQLELGKAAPAASTQRREHLLQAKRGFAEARATPLLESVNSLLRQ